MAIRCAHPDATNLDRFFYLKELNSNFSKRKVVNIPKNQINHGDPICTPRCNQSRHFLNLKELNSNFSKRKRLPICQKIKSIMAIRFADPDATNLARFFYLKELNSNFLKRKNLSINQINHGDPICTPRCNQSLHFFLCKVGKQ